jgi:hypothetical protein
MRQPQPQERVAPTPLKPRRDQFRNESETNEYTTVIKAKSQTSIVQKFPHKTVEKISSPSPEEDERQHIRHHRPNRALPDRNRQTMPTTVWQCQTRHLHSAASQW